MAKVPLLGGQHKVIYFGPRDNQKRDRYWAENGLVHHEDRDTGEYESLSVREFLERLNAINQMIRGDRQVGKQIGIDVDRQQKFIEEGVALAQKAREQGMPTDKDAVKDRLRRRKKTVVMPGSGSQYQL